MKISDLTQELESEILSRVPATSLCQLRPTCKRWYTLFKDPSFIKKNLGKAATQVILKKDLRIYSGIIKIHGNHNNFDPSIEFRGAKDSEHIQISEIFHCNGLLLCTTKQGRLVVWNPCTGQIRWIQHTRKPGFQKYYLGYQNNNGNYKILSSRTCFNNRSSVTEIYEFNSDSWRVLDLVTHHWYHWYPLSCVSFKGNTYWVNKNHMDHQFYSLLMFDFTIERVERLSLPFENPWGDETVVLSAVREEKLVLLRRTFGLDSLKIWVADTKIDEEAKDLSWSDFTAVDFSKLDVACLVGFLWDEENKMVVFCDRDRDNEGHDRFRIHIAGENMHKEVYNAIIDQSAFDYPLFLSYVPSLVQIQQATTGG